MTTPPAEAASVRGGGPSVIERFVLCSRGCQHWGALGAAGVLLRAAADPDPRYLLVLRHPRSHQGGTWALPGGALLPGESALAGALREAEEELGPLPAHIPRAHPPARAYVDDHGQWSYTTLVLDIGTMFEPSAANWETADWTWVSARHALTMPLLPALRAAWPALTDAV
ncbi:NUDIX hydrolase [Parafrankia sp. CH37]|uniref:NUDIX hydrolase n=1 Tax=Parafrankia sp. CH37 TaxID=683308 RepID=UPI00289C30E1|nr:NUDIX hydrolase [Parafrankia sp. CH37]